MPSPRITPLADYLVVNSSLESSRPAVDHDLALLHDGSQCSLLWLDALGEPGRVSVSGTASRIQANGQEVFVADGYSTTRIVERLHTLKPTDTWQIPVPAGLNLDSFFFTPELVGFVDLILKPADLGGSDHVFWIADSTSRPLGRVEPGGFVAVRGRPFCSSGRCVTVGEFRHVGNHAEHAWTLGAGRAEMQTLSTGSVYAATTVEADFEDKPALYDFFLQGESLFVARWTAAGWEGLGRLDGVVGFNATVDRGEPVLAWVQQGQTWRFSRMSGGALGAIHELAGTSAEDRVVFAPGSDGFDLAVLRMEVRRESGSYPRDLTILHHLSVRLGWVDSQGTVALGAPLEMEGEDSPNTMVVVPLVHDERATWLLQAPSSPRRLVRLEPCPVLP